MTFKNVFSLIKETYKEWTKDHASRLAAALAYYTIFSLAPLLVIVIAIAGFFFGREAITGEVVRQIGGLVGESGALAVQNLIIAAYKPAAGKIAAVLGLLTILYGASSFFGHLQHSLNAIWGVSTNPGRGIRGFIKDRFFSIVVVIGTGFLLLVSLIVSAAIDVIIHFFQGRLSGFDAVWTNLSFVFSFLVTSVIFALIFKVLPDVKIHWKVLPDRPSSRLR